MKRSELPDWPYSLDHAPEQEHASMGDPSAAPAPVDAGPIEEPDRSPSVPPPSIRPPSPTWRRITGRKLLRRIADAWHDFFCTYSLDLTYRLARTNWHSGHDVLSDIFRHVAVKKDDVLVEVGCGLGRVVGFLSGHYPRNRVIGIEADDTALFAKKVFAKNPRVEIRHGDFVEHYPKEGTLFYIFPPTDGGFLRKLKRLIDKNATLDTTIVAKGALGSLNDFRDDPSWTVEPVPAPTGALRRFNNTFFIYGHHLRGPGYHYGVILRKAAGKKLPPAA
jgi:hypothetical protein